MAKKVSSYSSTRQDKILAHNERHLRKNTYLCIVKTLTIMRRTMTKEKKLSLWERAKKMGKVLELTPGFSFDSDSQVKVYA